MLDTSKFVLYMDFFLFPRTPNSTVLEKVSKVFCSGKTPQAKKLITVKTRASNFLENILQLIYDIYLTKVIIISFITSSTIATNKCNPNLQSYYLLEESKLVERFFLDEPIPYQTETYYEISIRVVRCG